MFFFSPSSSFKTADASRLRRLSSSNMGIHAAASVSFSANKFIVIKLINSFSATAYLPSW